jgi:ribosomal protein L11 methyltransferase
MKWYKIEIKTETEAVDGLTYLLEENGIEGAIIEDPNDLMFQDKYIGDWDYSEDSARQYDHEDVLVRVFIEETKDIKLTIKMIEEILINLKNNGLDIGTGMIAYEIVDDIAWKDKWKEYFKPFKIASRIVVKPSWEDYISENEDIIIEMDPGSAFGSGTHETTSLCVELLELVIKPDDKVYDIGCGTGILGISAALLGAREVVGVDISEDAIIATKENIKKNSLEDIMTVQLGSLTQGLNGRADIILANIMADIIISMNETIEKFIVNDGYYITSGIIEGRQEEVLSSLKKCGFEIINHKTKGEWHGILACYKK